jgi:putative endonuclease
MAKDLDSCRLGRYGEDVACAFLKLKGFRILERNYRVGRLEIDIIALHEDELVFVEVKLRCKADFGGPWSAVDWKKQREITRAAAGYMFRSRDSARACRFDVVGIVINENAESLRIRHVERAFDASRHLGLFF